MQTMFMEILIGGFRRVILNREFLRFKKKIFHPAHFIPSGRAILPANGNVIPSQTPRRDYAKTVFGTHMKTVFVGIE